MLKLDYYAYNNKLVSRSIIEKITLGLGGLVLVLFFDNLKTNTAIILLMHAVICYAGIPLFFVGRFWLATVPFLLVSCITVALSIGTQVDQAAAASISLGTLTISVTPAGLVMAEKLIGRSFAAVSCLLMLTTTTPVSHIVAYFSRFRYLRTLMEIILLTYRFIFIILVTAEKTYAAQQARLGYHGFRRSVTSMGFLAAAVARKSFIHVYDIHQALLSRNYREQLVFRYQRQRLSIAGLLTVIVLLGFIIWLNL